MGDAEGPFGNLGHFASFGFRCALVKARSGRFRLVTEV
jgi:hypothetical protein